MEAIFSRNIPTLSRAEQDALAGKRVFIAGCGGLGGYVCEFLVRAGVGHIAAADCDCFEASNRNRQILALESTLGRSKAEAAAARAREINPAVDFAPFVLRIDEENLPMLLKDCDAAVDALDNIPVRLALEDACGRMGIPLVHGAVHGYQAQAAVILPGQGLLHRLYAGAGKAADSSVLSPVPPVCAGVECSETIRLLLGKPAPLAGKLLMMDLLNMEFETVEF